MAGERGLAKEIRTGLGEVVEPSTAAKVQKETRPLMTALEGGKESSRSVLDEYSYGKTKREHVKEFGALFAAIFFAIAAWLLYKGKPLNATSVWVLCSVAPLFAILGYKVPLALYPLWKGWMTFAHYLGMVMTFLILSLAWTLVVLPVALCLRIVRRNVMDMNFRTSAPTYWMDCDKKKSDFTLLERQF